VWLSTLTGGPPHPRMGFAPAPSALDPTLPVVLATLDFYATAATIYPIIFIAVLLEAPTPQGPSRLELSNRQQLLIAAYLLAIMAMLITGEVAALHVLDVGHATEGWHRVVRDTLLGAGSLAVGQMLTTQFAPLGRTAHKFALGVLAAGFIAWIVFSAVHH
jgi:hypothetical protein